MQENSEQLDWRRVICELTENVPWRRAHSEDDAVKVVRDDNRIYEPQELIGLDDIMPDGERVWRVKKKLPEPKYKKPSGPTEDPEDDEGYSGSTGPR